MTRRILLLCLFLLAACRIAGPDGSAEPNWGDEPFLIAGGSSFGECIGYCRTELTIGPERMTLAILSQGNVRIPDRLYERPVSRDEWARLVSLLPTAAFRALDEVYGCPDCADGGAEWVEINEEDSVQRVTFEYGRSVPGIEDLIDEMRSLREEWAESVR